MIESLGFQVLRQIPLEYVTGIARQIYSVHGGVIREAATGRIVAHLALPAASAASTVLGAVPAVGLAGSVVNAFQLHALSKTVQQVLTVSLANTALAGLGLATSLVGFAYLSHRIGGLERQVAGIRDWLGTASEGQLKSAVSDLSHAARDTDPATRRSLLVSAKSAFTSLAHHYRRQSILARTVANAAACEDFAVTAMIGAVTCASNLGLHDAAAEDFRRFRAEWSDMARIRTVAMLDLDNAARLLDARYVEQLPTSELIAVLDFARDDSRGVRWIDELRRGHSPVSSLASNLRPVPDDALAYARRLCARNDVLGSYESHFDALATHRLSVTDFERITDQATAGGRLALLLPATA